MRIENLEDGGQPILVGVFQAIADYTKITGCKPDVIRAGYRAYDKLRKSIPLPRGVNSPKRYVLNGIPLEPCAECGLDDVHVLVGGWDRGKA